MSFETVLQEAAQIAEGIAEQVVLSFSTAYLAKTAGARNVPAITLKYLGQLTAHTAAVSAATYISTAVNQAAAAAQSATTTTQAPATTPAA